ncbi:MFS transporter, partial [Francisella tularensis subsp. holarctica]|nr:MFS transporter [Francisella tularensis subsp. holarctica]
MQNIIMSFILVFVIRFYCFEFFLRILSGAYQEQIVEHFNISKHIGFTFVVYSNNIKYLLMQKPAGIIH